MLILTTAALQMRQGILLDLSTCTIFLPETEVTAFRQYKIKNFVLNFALLSTCTIFAVDMNN